MVGAGAAEGEGGYNQSSTQSMFAQHKVCPYIHTSLAAETNHSLYNLAMLRYLGREAGGGGGGGGGGLRGGVEREAWGMGVIPVFSESSQL